jgi:cobalt-precorrin 5A hydrolase
MKIAIIALTKNAIKVAERLCPELQADLYGMPAWLPAVAHPELRIYSITQKFGELVGALFDSYQALVFIMACGIVVRSIAPYLQNKCSDPAVVVVDEQGRFAISLAGGHLGGANQLARQIAFYLGGQAVITTATDLNRVVALEMFAQANDCIVENDTDLKYISAALVNGERVAFFTDCRLEKALSPPLWPGRPDKSEKYAVVLSNSTAWQLQAERTLLIRPQNLIVGLGCKKGTSAGLIAESLADLMAKNHKSWRSLKALASLDLKASEPGIIAFCQAQNLPFVTVAPEAIHKVEGDLTFSPFVQKTVGVGGVAEPCALLGGVKTRLICPKTVYPGLTLALAEEEKVFCL